MNSVERILHYTTTVPEDYTRDDYVQVPKNWPQKGAIQFKNAALKYLFTKFF